MASIAKFITRSLAVLMLLALGAQQSLAQVPPHEPGSVCATDSFWCWAEVTGAVGSPCTCPTPDGPVTGVYV